jgi:dephospho-CoA kinase
MGAGKSRVGDLLAKHEDFHHVSITGLLNEQARQRGGTPYVNLLRKSGKGQVVQSVMPAVRDGFLASGRRGLVLDGVRRPEDVEVLRKTFPNASIYLLHVSTTTPLRVKRVANREKISEAAAAKAVALEDRRKLHEGIGRLRMLPGIDIVNEHDKPGLLLSDVREALKRAQMKELIAVLRRYATTAR